MDMISIQRRKVKESLRKEIRQRRMKRLNSLKEEVALVTIRTRRGILTKERLSVITMRSLVIMLMSVGTKRWKEKSLK